MYFYIHLSMSLPLGMLEDLKDDNIKNSILSSSWISLKISTGFFCQVLFASTASSLQFLGNLNRHTFIKLSVSSNSNNNCKWYFSSHTCFPYKSRDQANSTSNATLEKRIRCYFHTKRWTPLEGWLQGLQLKGTELIFSAIVVWIKRPLIWF